MPRNTRRNHKKPSTAQQDVTSATQTPSGNEDEPDENDDTSGSISVGSGNGASVPSVPTPAIPFAQRSRARALPSRDDAELSRSLISKWVSSVEMTLMSILRSRTHGDNPKRLCTTSLAMTTRVITSWYHGAGRRFPKSLLKDYPQYVSTAFVFLFSERTDEELTRQRQLLDTCICGEEDFSLYMADFDAFHAMYDMEGNVMTSTSSPSITFDACSMALFSIATVCISNFPWTSAVRAEEEGTRSYFRDHPRLTPVAHYLLDNPTGTVAACHRWFRVTGVLDSILFLHICLMHIPERFQLAVLNHRALASAISDRLESEVAPLRIGSRLTFEGQSHAHTIKNFIAGALEDRGDEAMEQEITSFFRADARRLYDALLLLVSHHDTPQLEGDFKTGIGPGPQWEHERRERGAVARRLHGMIPESMAVELDPRIDDGKRPAQDFSPTGQFFSMAYRYISERVVCMRISCPKATRHHLAGKPYPKCNRCKFITYCSRECQQAAWAAPRYPHRDFCHFFSALREVKARFPDTFWAFTADELIEQLVSCPTLSVRKKERNPTSPAADDNVENPMPSRMSTDTQASDPRELVDELARDMLVFYLMIDEENEHDGAPSYNRKSYVKYKIEDPILIP